MLTPCGLVLRPVLNWDPARGPTTFQPNCSYPPGTCFHQPSPLPAVHAHPVRPNWPSHSPRKRLQAEVSDLAVCHVSHTSPGRRCLLGQPPLGQPCPSPSPLPPSGTRQLPVSARPGGLVLPHRPSSGPGLASPGLSPWVRLPWGLT